MITFIYLIISLIYFIFTGETIIPEHLQGKDFILLLLFMFVEYFIEMCVFGCIYCWIKDEQQTR